MNKNRLWMAGVAIAIVAIAFVGWFLGISPILSQTSSAKLQQSALAVSNSTSEVRVAALKKQFDNIGALQASLDSLSESIPSAAAVPVFLREVNALGAQNGVTVGSVDIDDPQPFVSQIATPAATSSSSDSTEATASASPSPSASASAATDSSTASSESGALSDRLVQIPISITVTGPYGSVMAFVGGLQNGERLYLVNSLSVIKMVDSNTDFSATIGGFIYVLPAAK